jgi:hypothetical protein
VRAPDGTVAEEEWLNRRTGQTRREKHGQHGDTTVSDGRRIWRWNDLRTLSLTEVLEQRDPWLRPTSLLLEVWRDLLGGRATIIGESEFAGTPTWVVELQPGREAPPGFRALAEVERATFFVRRLSYGVPGALREAVLEQEALPDASVPARLFAPPEDLRWTLRERRLAHADLARTVPFPVYAPPPRAGQLRFVFAVLQEQRGASAGGLPSAARRSLYVGYASGDDPYVDAPFALIQRRRTARDDRWFGTLRRAGKLVVLRIGGKPREAWIGGGRSQMISLLLPGTTVAVRSELEREQTLVMVSALRRRR